MSARTHCTVGVRRIRKFSTQRAKRRGAQRGISLIIVMLILVVVTILGIGGAQIALLGERATRYDRDYLIASQAAEAALIDAELDIDGGGTRAALFASGAKVGPGCGSSSTDRGMCQPSGDYANPVWTTVDFLDTSGSAQTVKFGDFTGRPFDSAIDPGASGNKAALPPRYLIEFMPDKTGGTNAAPVFPPPILYRITAMGFGPRQDVQVVLQTTFRKRPP